MPLSTRRNARGLVLLVLAAGLALSLQAQVTETPDTIPPGKFRVRMDGVRVSMDRADAAGNTYTAVAVGSTIVSVGVTDTLDVQVGLDLFLRQSYEAFRRTDSDSGIGNASFRFKWTFWRNEEGTAAMAVIPYVSVPSGSSAVASNSLGGGFIVPWAMRVPGGVTTGAMFQWDVQRGPSRSGYDSLWRLTGFAQRPLAFGLSIYGEATFETTSGAGSGTTGSLGVGALWQLSDHLRLDYELLRGINDRAGEWTHVARINWEW